MPLVPISDDLKNLLDRNKPVIKGDYITYRLFVDSAIRTRLRAMDIPAGQDEIVAHLEKLKASKSRHLQKQSISHTLSRHKKRLAKTKHSLKEI